MRDNKIRTVPMFLSVIFLSGSPWSGSELLDRFELRRIRTVSASMPSLRQHIDPRETQAGRAHRPLLNRVPQQ